MSQDDFKFPDEVEAKKVDAAADDFEFEIEDDTPPEDRNRNPLPKEMAEELEKDELEEYSEAAKQKLQQMKKVWHDERREKERALREQQEAIAYAQRIMDENKRLKETLTKGEKNYIDTYKGAAELELDAAKRAYKEAYDMGDGDRLLEAQEKLSQANYKLQKAQEYVPSLQHEESDVKVAPEVQAPRPDQRAVAWQERNQWFGKDEEMTSLALGLHQKLVNQYGASYPTTDEYWKKVDETMQRRFPDYFGDTKQDDSPPPEKQRVEKPSTVVAPATRSTSSKKIVLKQSQLAIAKKLGLTPEQYAREMMKIGG